jgi:hypothetical protein
MSFRAEMAMFRPRSVTGLKIHMGKITKVTIGLAKQLREGDTIRCLLMSQMSERIYNAAQRVQGSCMVIPTHFRIQRYNLLEENNENK